MSIIVKRELWINLRGKPTCLTLVSERSTEDWERTVEDARKRSCNRENWAGGVYIAVEEHDDEQRLRRVMVARGKLKESR